MKAVFKGVRPVTKSFFALNRTFPLRPIRSDEELAAAVEVAAELMPGDLDEGEADYLDALAALIQMYEERAHPVPDASPGEVLKMLMESNGLSQNQLRAETGIAQSTVSAVLAGKRELTIEQILVLADRFNVAPVAFLPRGRTQTLTTLTEGAGAKSGGATATKAAAQIDKGEDDIKGVVMKKSLFAAGDRVAGGQKIAFGTVMKATDLGVTVPLGAPKGKKGKPATT